MVQHSVGSPQTCTLPRGVCSETDTQWYNRKSVMICWTYASSVDKRVAGDGQPGGMAVFLSTFPNQSTIDGDQNKLFITGLLRVFWLWY